MDFWEEMTTPIPLYTEENIEDTIEYIASRTNTPFAQIHKTSLLFVLSQLTKAPFDDYSVDVSDINKARQAAEQRHDNAVSVKEFVSAVRWRYIMAALTDYRNALIKKEMIL